MEQHLALQDPRFKNPLVQACHMAPEMKQEAIEACISSLEKFPSEYEQCAQAVKDILETKFGSAFCVTISKDFSYSIAHSSQHLFYYLGSASLGFLIWKV